MEYVTEAYIREKPSVRFSPVVDQLTEQAYDSTSVRHFAAAALLILHVTT